MNHKDYWAKKYVNNVDSTDMLNFQKNLFYHHHYLKKVSGFKQSGL